MSFNALLHFRTESRHFAAMSGISCIIELYCSYVHCSFRRFLEKGFFSFLSVVRGRKWVLLSSFLLHFTLVADEEDTEANTVLPIFLPATVFLLTVDADRSFTIWGIDVACINVFVEVSLLLFPVSVRIVAEADVRPRSFTFVLYSSSSSLFPVQLRLYMSFMHLFRVYCVVVVLSLIHI